MPASYNTQQKGAISEFTGVTQSDKTNATKLLKQHNWNVQAAINAYVLSNLEPLPASQRRADFCHSFFNSSNGAGSNNPLRSHLNKIFDKYRESPREEPDEINIEGTGQLLGELEIDLEDIGFLVFSEIVQSPTMGKITREGFVDGWSEATIDTLPKMRNLILQRRSELSTNTSTFKNIYNHTFVIALPSGSKTLPLEVALVFWQLVFGANGYHWRTNQSPWLDWWVTFQQEKHTKAINKDLWKQTLNFAMETMKDDSLGFWNEESSWPSVVDEFVEWVKIEKRPGAAANGDAMEVE